MWPSALPTRIRSQPQKAECGQERTFGDALLKDGQLEPRYPSFLEFLRFFFGEASTAV